MSRGQQFNKFSPCFYPIILLFLKKTYKCPTAFPIKGTRRRTVKLEAHNREGYSTCMVDAHEHGNAAHDAGPLSFEFVRLPEVTVDARVQ